jgi:hypothetical protein
MAVRGLAYRTRKSYVDAVAQLARHYGRRPDELSEAEVQRYLLYLLEERKLAHSTVNVACRRPAQDTHARGERASACLCLRRPPGATSGRNLQFEHNPTGRQGNKPRPPSPRPAYPAKLDRNCAAQRPPMSVITHIERKLPSELSSAR